jgi:hypothetical protein
MISLVEKSSKTIALFSHAVHFFKDQDQMLEYTVVENFIASALFIAL